MYFDRFDICDAWYLALSAAHGGQSSPEYERLSRLTNFYSPGLSRSVDSLTENGLEIYWQACELLAGS